MEEGKRGDGELAANGPSKEVMANTHQLTELKTQVTDLTKLVEKLKKTVQIFTEDLDTEVRKKAAVVCII